VCMFASLQVYKFTSLQIYKIKKSRNCKLMITNLQNLQSKNFELHKLQVRFCKFASLHLYKLQLCMFTSL